MATKVKPSDGDLLDGIASYGLSLSLDESRECLRLANEVFCGRRFGKADREYAEGLLARLKGGAS